MGGSITKNHKFVTANQLLKSGTSIGVNIREAQNAESKADFIHRLKIAAKKLMKPTTGYCSVKDQQDMRIANFYRKIVFQ